MTRIEAICQAAKLSIHTHCSYCIHESKQYPNVYYIVPATQATTGE